MTHEQKKQIDAYLVSCLSRKFQWGSWDCGLFCADILAILTGNDFAAAYRGGYTDRVGSINVLPCRLGEMPEYIGLKPSYPRDGALWWAPALGPEGALGVFWQGRCLQPGRRGLRVAIRDTSKLKFYY